MAQTKTIAEDAFKADSQEFKITSDPNTTFIITDKDGNDVVQMDAVREYSKDYSVTLGKAAAPYTVTYEVHVVHDIIVADKDADFGPDAVSV